MRFAAWLLISLAAYPEDLPLGKIVDEVKCASDPSQSYALYLPSNYSQRRANAKDDSADRRMARRVLRGTFSRSFEQIRDADYQKRLNDIRR